MNTEKNSDEMQKRAENISGLRISDNAASPSVNSMTDDQKLAEIENDLNKLSQTSERIDLADKIMTKIEARTNKQTVSWWDHPVWEQIFAPAQLRFAFVLFAGVIIGASLVWFFNTGGTLPQQSILSGTMSSVAGNEISYAYQHASYKLIPYRIDNLYYLNFLINSTDEMETEVTFLESEYSLVSSGFLSKGNNNSAYYSGKVVFAASEMSNFQLVFEKTTENQASVMVVVNRNKNQIIKKELFLK